MFTCRKRFLAEWAVVMDHRKAVPPTSVTKERAIPVIPFVTLVLLAIGAITWVNRSFTKNARAYEAPLPFTPREFTAQELEEHPNDPPLIRAIRDDDVKTALALIDTGADINQRNSDDGTPLLYSSGGLGDRMLSVTKALVARGADVNVVCGPNKVTPLHFACSGGNVETAEFLLSKGADVNARDSDGDAPLHVTAITCFKSPLATVKVLLAHGADINASDKRGLTVLDVMQKFHWRTTSAFLASKGAKNG